MSDPELLMSNAGLAQLKADEGFRGTVYNDATGLPVQKWNLSMPGNLTIGYGLNLFAGITADEAEYLLINRLISNGTRLERIWPDFPRWPQMCLDVALMIDYNTGDVSKWPGFINAVRSRMQGDIIASNIRSSEAWRSSLTHARYERFALAVISGSWNHA
jgi:hypothetical protein